MFDSIRHGQGLPVWRRRQAAVAIEKGSAGAADGCDSIRWLWRLKRASLSGGRHALLEENRFAAYSAAGESDFAPLYFDVRAEWLELL
ncbi:MULTISPECIES: hypothetical protein [Rhizobium]|uniref:Uncharacterized protein n=1 Tax=Rhizobium paranaense TaxID=1650438 RepID=A0A7W9D0M4_9HYPH|nr:MULTISPECIES: hypothetical protein [Rhizobium]MBB5573422.1 hypothetical protein [Rhizobium paranaense]